MNSAICYTQTYVRHAMLVGMDVKKREHVSCHMQNKTLKTSLCDGNKELNAKETNCEKAENEFSFCLFVCAFCLKARDTICVKIYSLEITF